MVYVKKGGNGGKRIGAGAKPLLTLDQQLWVGSECERLWREVYQKALEAEIAMRTAAHSLEIDRIKQILVVDRQDFLASTAFDDHLDDIEFATKTDQGIDAESNIAPTYVVNVVAKRPKGYRAGILDTVKEVAISEYGVQLSAGTVERCWKKFRSFEKSIRSDD